MERFCGSLAVAVQSRKHPYACLAHRVRDVSRLSMIKVQYGLTKELEINQRRAIMSSGQAQRGCKYKLHYERIVSELPL